MAVSDRVDSSDELGRLRRLAERGRELVERSPEIVVVLDSEGRIVASSRRARTTLEGLVEGEPPPAALIERGGVTRVPIEVDGEPEMLVYVGGPGALAAYEELRAGFTAAVSHELRTPLARVLALLETAVLSGQSARDLIDQARAEIEQIGELIDEVLFLSELETGRTVVTLTSTRALPVIRETFAELSESALRAGVTLKAEGDEDAELPLRPRMLRVVVENLAKNAIRHAGDGASFTVTVHTDELRASDNGVGVSAYDLPRLFERFYRTDRSRASRGTGLGLAIVKHIVASADGTIEAQGARDDGLTIVCRFGAKAETLDSA